MPLFLDAQGQRNLKAIAEQTTKEVESEQRAAARRIAKAGKGGVDVAGYIYALFAFESVWQPSGQYEGGED